MADEAWVMLVVVVVVAWVACGVWGAGYYFAFFQDNWPSLAAKDYNSDRRKAMWGVLFGPVALFVELSMGHKKYGWRLPRLTKD